MMKFEQWPASREPVEAPRERAVADSETVRQFQESCFSRLDELVAEGVCPKSEADERKRLAALIDTSIGDPVRDGRAYAEAGMENIRQFREKVDEAIQQVTAQVEEVQEKLEAVKRALLAQKVVPIDIREKLEIIDRENARIEEGLRSFIEQAKRVKEFQISLGSALESLNIREVMTWLEEEMEDKK